MKTPFSYFPMKFILTVSEQSIRFPQRWKTFYEWIKHGHESAKSLGTRQLLLLTQSQSLWPPGHRSRLGQSTLLSVAHASTQQTANLCSGASPRKQGIDRQAREPIREKSLSDWALPLPAKCKGLLHQERCRVSASIFFRHTTSIKKRLLWSRVIFAMDIFFKPMEF